MVEFGGCFPNQETISTGLNVAHDENRQIIPTDIVQLEGMNR